MHEHHMSLTHIMRRLPLTAGLVLLDARHERRNPGGSSSYIDRLAMRATDEEQARIEREFTII